MDQNNQQPNLLVFGILSIALCGFLGILSIIFGSIGRSKGKSYVARGGTLTGASKVGFILSKIGLIFGIITLVCFILIVVLKVAGVIDESVLSY